MKFPHNFRQISQLAKPRPWTGVIYMGSWVIFTLGGEGGGGGLLMPLPLFVLVLISCSDINKTKPIFGRCIYEPRLTAAGTVQHRSTAARRGGSSQTCQMPFIHPWNNKNKFGKSIFYNKNHDQKSPSSLFQCIPMQDEHTVRNKLASPVTSHAEYAIAGTKVSSDLTVFGAFLTWIVMLDYHFSWL